MPSNVAVVGAGVIGLTTGVRLAELGLRVHVYTAAPPYSTTSAAAGAIWDPLYANHPCVPLWAARTHGEFTRMARTGVGGVRLVEGIEASRAAVKAPAWTQRLPGFHECRSNELPRGFVTGWRYTAPLIDMPTFLGYLQERLLRARGELVYRTVRSLSDDLDAAVVVNCSGMGARELVPDAEVRAIRGHLVAVRNPGISEFFIELNDGMSESTYFLPQGDVLLLGGSAEPDRSSPVPDRDVARAIVTRCAEVQPAITGADLLGYRVGTRPHRGQIRLERVSVGGRHVVHNYGHSGSGVSLSWGCADDVTEMVVALL
jgi:D-amino-acid oxidase